MTGDVSRASATGSFGPVGPVSGETCPCAGLPTGTPYGECCGPVHAGQRGAATAEELMRSRYSAFALGEEAYLLRSWHPRTRPEELHLDPQHVWTGLEVLETSGGGRGEEIGMVTYRARSRGTDGRAHVMTEVSRFERRAGRWLYVAGDVT